MYWILPKKFTSLKQLSESLFQYVYVFKLCSQNRQRRLLGAEIPTNLSLSCVVCFYIGNRDLRPCQTEKKHFILLGWNSLPSMRLCVHAIHVRGVLWRGGAGMSPVTEWPVCWTRYSTDCQTFRPHSEAIEIFWVKCYKRLIEIHVAHTSHSKRSSCCSLDSLCSLAYICML